MSESTRMMLGLVIGIAIMIVLVMKTKVHTFIALLLAALITGLIGGMPVADITNAAGETTVGVMTAIKDGFGNTLKSTGIIIGLGVMMGGILEVSGAAEQLAFTFYPCDWQEKRRMGTGNHRMGCIHPGFRRFRNRNFRTTCKSNVLCNRNLCCRTCTVTGLWTSADTLSGTADTGTADSSRNAWS